MAHQGFFLRCWKIMELSYKASGLPLSHAFLIFHFVSANPRLHSVALRLLTSELLIYRCLGS